MMRGKTMKPFALALIAGSLIASHALAGDFGARTLAPSLAPSLRPPSTSTQLRPSISRPSLLSEYGVPSTTGSSLPSQQPTTTYSPPSSASRTARWEAPLDSAYAPTARDDSAYPRAAAGVDDALDYRARASARVNEDLGLQPGSRVDGVGLLPRVRVEGDPLPPGSPVDGAGLLPRLRVDDSSTPAWRLDGARASARLDEDLGLRPRLDQRTTKTAKELEAERIIRAANDPRASQLDKDKEWQREKDAKPDYWERAAPTSIWAPRRSAAAPAPVPNSGAVIDWDYMRSAVRMGVTTVLTWAGDY